MAGRGAPLVDVDCTGTAIRDFVNVADEHRFDEETVVQLFGAPPRTRCWSRAPGAGVGEGAPLERQARTSRCRGGDSSLPKAAGPLSFATSSCLGPDPVDRAKLLLLDASSRILFANCTFVVPRFLGGNLDLGGLRRLVRKAMTKLSPAVSPCASLRVQIAVRGCAQLVTTSWLMTISCW